MEPRREAAASRTGKEPRHERLPAERARSRGVTAAPVREGATAAARPARRRWARWGGRARRGDSAGRGGTAGGSGQGRGRARARWARHASAWLWLAPALILFALFKFVPMARAISMSFKEVRPYL